MRKNKKNFLRLEKSKKPLFNKTKIKSPFFRLLANGELSLSLPAFILLSIASGLLAYVLYTLTIGSGIYAISAGIMSLTFPYLCYKAPSLMKQKVDGAIEYKNFINILKSSLRVSNSTSEAIEICAAEKDLAKNIREMMERIVSNMKLGDSVEEALRKAIEESDNVHFKMALTIVMINHNVGSSASIDALNNILKSMDATISNIELLKDKINTAVMEKILFLVIILSVPVIHSILPKEIIMNFYSTIVWQVVMALLLGYSYIGQFIMDYSASTAIERI